jgi:hypothetical protein
MLHGLVQSVTKHTREFAQLCGRLAEIVEEADEPTRAAEAQGERRVWSMREKRSGSFFLSTLQLVQLAPSSL